MMKHARLTALLLMIALLIAALPAAWAGPLAQTPAPIGGNAFG